MVHLTVTELLRHGAVVRRRGEALCRTRLPNLELLDVQRLEGRRCCPACIDAMARIRLRLPIALPPSAGLRAGDLIRALQHERERSKKSLPRRPARSIADV